MFYLRIFLTDIASFDEEPLTYRYYHDDGVSIDYLNKDNISEISTQ